MPNPMIPNQNATNAAAGSTLAQMNAILTMKTTARAMAAERLTAASYQRQARPREESEADRG